MLRLSKLLTQPTTTQPETAEKWVGEAPTLRHQRASAWRYILLLFLSSRFVLTLIGVISYTFIDRGYGKQFSWSKYTGLDLWGVWDSYWYMDIAKNGYSTVGSIAGNPDQTNFPFFPLYPMLMKLIGGITGGKYFLAGLLISNACLLISAFVLYQLVVKDAGPKTARRAIKYLFLFPISFIFSGVFTESLYLCLTLLCFYCAKRRNWWLVGVFGALLSATRTLGVLIVLPMLFEYLRSIGFKLKQVRFNSLFLLLIPLGLLIFCVYSYQATGDFLYFKTNQAAWQREIANPVVVLWQAGRTGIETANPKILLELGFSLLALMLLNIGYRKIGFAYWLVGMYSIVIPLSAGIDSMARYVLPIFPMFIVLAQQSRRDDSCDDVMMLLCGSLQGALMVYWCTGQALVV